MTSPLQIISVSDRERTTIYQTYTRESIAVIHQQKERVSLSTASPFNDLAHRKNDGNQNEEWTTKSHIMLPNYFLDHIDLIRQNRKRMYESCTIHESYPALEKTEIKDTSWLEQSPRKISSRMTTSQCRCMKIRRDVFVIMQSAKRTGIFRQQCLPSRLLGEQFQLQNNQLPIRMLGFHRVRRQLI